MSQPVTPAPEAQAADTASSVEQSVVPKPSRPPSYVKLAMRNMVRKGSKSLFHFSLTTVTLVGLLITLAYLTR